MTCPGMGPDFVRRLVLYDLITMVMGFLQTGILPRMMLRAFMLTLQNDILYQQLNNATS